MCLDTHFKNINKVRWIKTRMLLCYHGRPVPDTPNEPEPYLLSRGYPVSPGTMKSGCRSTATRNPKLYPLDLYFKFVSQRAPKVLPKD